MKNYEYYHECVTTEYLPYEYVIIADYYPNNNSYVKLLYEEKTEADECYNKYCPIHRRGENFRHPHCADCPYRVGEVKTTISLVNSFNSFTKRTITRNIKYYNIWDLHWYPWFVYSSIFLIIVLTIIIIITLTN